MGQSLMQQPGGMRGSAARLWPPSVIRHREGPVTTLACVTRMAILRCRMIRKPAKPVYVIDASVGLALLTVLIAIVILVA